MREPLRAALTLWLCLALDAAAPASADPLQEFETRTPITLQGDGPYYQLTLPLEAHFGSHFLDMRDLRVFNGQGEMVPFSLIKGRSRADEAVLRAPLTWFPLYATDAPDSVPEIRVERRADGTLVSVKGGEAKDPGRQKLRGYLLDVSRNKDAARKLELDWDSAVTGFQQLTVEASDDLQMWRTWQHSAQLARLEFGGQRLERKQIELPGDHADYIRLTWNTPQEAPQLTSVILTSSTSTYRPAPFLWSGALQPTRTSAGEYEWEFPQRLAIEQVKIGLPLVNVLAPAELWGKAGTEVNAAWQLLTTIVLYRLLIDGKELQQQEVALAGLPVKMIKLKSDPRSGGLGAGMPTLTFGVASHQVLFLARGPGPFVLAEGNGQAAAADLSPATLIPGYGTSAAPPISTAMLASMPSDQAVPPALAPEAKSAFANWKTMILWAVLLTGIAAIAAMALHLLRQTQA
jgi:Protein of unknown function (DUF3999)